MSKDRKGDAPAWPAVSRTGVPPLDSSVPRRSAGASGSSHRIEDRLAPAHPLSTSSRTSSRVRRAGVPRDSPNACSHRPPYSQPETDGVTRSVCSAWRRFLEAPLRMASVWRFERIHPNRPKSSPLSVRTLTVAHAPTIRGVGESLLALFGRASPRTMPVGYGDRLLVFTRVGVDEGELWDQAYRKVPTNGPEWSNLSVQGLQDMGLNYKGPPRQRLTSRPSTKATDQILSFRHRRFGRRPEGVTGSRDTAASSPVIHASGPGASAVPPEVCRCVPVHLRLLFSKGHRYA